MQEIIIKTYTDLHRFAAAFARREFNLLIVVGRPGVAKSETIRAAIPGSACWIEGNATAYGIYEHLFHFQSELVVIDDVDSIYTDRAAVRLLKSLCNTKPVKRLSWHSRAAGNAIPREFETSSQVCIISNDWKTLNDNVHALIDRGQFILFEPTAEEVHAQTAKWFDDGEVFEWFARHLHYFPALSMRNYVRASELRKAGFPWADIMLSHVPDNVRKITEIIRQTDFQSENERVAAFCQQTGASRATYFNLKKRLSTVG